MIRCSPSPQSTHVNRTLVYHESIWHLTKRGAEQSALEQKKAGDPAVLSALKDMKDLHRNPLIHPEHFLETVDDAIALVGGIQAVVVPMLKAIPEPPAPLPLPEPEPPPAIVPVAS